MRLRDLARFILFAGAFALPGVAHAQAPDLEEDDETEEPAMPPGHPGGGGGAQPAVPGMFQASPDVVQEDATLPPGSIGVEIRDADDKPLPNQPFTLDTLIKSIAKGDSHKNLSAKTDASGRFVFSGMDTGIAFEYHVIVNRDGATFTATIPFIAQDKSEKVVLHVYPTTPDIQKALIVMEAYLYADLRDDRVQFEQGFKVHNFSRIAWTPDNVSVKLPMDFTALNTGEMKANYGVTLDPGRGVRFTGTFKPGASDVVFRWQLPWSNEKDIDLEAGLPPHVAVVRVIVAASPETKLLVDGFPAAKWMKDHRNDNVLVTERALKREDAELRRLRIGIHDLPTPGPARNIVTAVAACGVLVGIGFAFAVGKQRPRAATQGKSARQALLAELEDLERAHASGDIGPKTYERARRELVDAIARTLATESTSKRRE